MIALIAVPASMLVTRTVGRRAQAHFAEQWKTTGDLNSTIEEAYTGYMLVRAFGREPERLEIFREHNEKLYRSGVRAQAISGLIGPATAPLGNFGYVLIAVIGGFQVAAGSLSIGSVQAFVRYSRQFTQPLMALANLSNLVQSGVASAERVFEYLDTPEEPTTGGAPAGGSGRVDGRVRLEAVCFRYQPDQPLIEQLSLTVELGQLIDSVLGGARVRRLAGNRLDAWALRYVDAALYGLDIQAPSGRTS